MGHPHNLRVGFSHAWKNLGGYNKLKKEIYRKVLIPWKCFISDGEQVLPKKKHVNILNLERQIPPPNGILFHGPIGTGKSLAAKCLASCLGFDVINVRVYNIYLYYHLIFSFIL